MIENKAKLKNDINDLNVILTDLSTHSPSLVNSLIKIMKAFSPVVKSKLDNEKYTREIKDRNLVDEYMKIFNSEDIAETLNISIGEADLKVEKYSFTEEEKEIIINTFKGCSGSFIKKINGKLEVS